jgi:hypothetical protein
MFFSSEDEDFPGPVRVMFEVDRVKQNLAITGKYSNDGRNQRTKPRKHFVLYY